MHGAPHVVIHTCEMWGPAVQLKVAVSTQKCCAKSNRSIFTLKKCRSTVFYVYYNNIRYFLNDIIKKNIRRLYKKTKTKSYL